MEEEIDNILEGFHLKEYDLLEVRKKLLNLFSVRKSVFVVCENDDYGRDLYLSTKNTIEEAQELKGRDNTRHIYEHEVLKTDF